MNLPFCIAMDLEVVQVKGGSKVCNSPMFQSLSDPYVMLGRILTKLVHHRVSMDYLMHIIS